MVDQGIFLFGSNLLGNESLRENQRERQSLSNLLELRLTSAKKELKSSREACKPDRFRAVATTYVQLRYVLQVDFIWLLVEETYPMAQGPLLVAKFVSRYMLHIGALVGFLQLWPVQDLCKGAVGFAPSAWSNPPEDVAQAWRRVVDWMPSWMGFSYDASASHEEIANQACSQVLGPWATLLNRVVDFLSGIVEPLCTCACKELHKWFNVRVLRVSDPVLGWLSLICIIVLVHILSYYRPFRLLLLRPFRFVAFGILADICALKLSSWLLGGIVVRVVVFQILSYFFGLSLGSILRAAAVAVIWYLSSLFGLQLVLPALVVAYVLYSVLQHAARGGDEP